MGVCAASPLVDGCACCWPARAPPDSTNFITSSRVTRPLWPEPAIIERSMLCSRASRRTAGVVGPLYEPAPLPLLLPFPFVPGIVGAATAAVAETCGALGCDVGCAVR